MTATLLTLAYALPASNREPRDLLKIEQQQWSRYTGQITKQEMVRWLAAAIGNEAYQSQIDCAMTGDNLACTLFVYPYLADLPYQLHTSWGTLSERSVAMLEISELVQFKLTTSETVKNPVRRILAVKWADECYGPEGEIVNPPELTANLETISCMAPVYGTATVKYLCERHAYVLNAPRRAAAIDNHFSAVVVGVYAGGLTYHVVEMPPGVETFVADPNAECGRQPGWGGSADWPEDGKYPPLPRTANRLTIVDYCSQKVLSDVTTL
jgi:hypothetical protein